jgi:hypothetical protein
VRTLDQWREKVADVLPDAADRRIADVVFHNRSEGDDITNIIRQVTRGTGSNAPWPNPPTDAQIARVVNALSDKGTRNLVVWDDSIITTLKRNDETIADLAKAAD